MFLIYYRVFFSLMLSFIIFLLVALWFDGISFAKKNIRQVKIVISIGLVLSAGVLFALYLHISNHTYYVEDQKGVKTYYIIGSDVNPELNVDSVHKDLINIRTSKKEKLELLRREDKERDEIWTDIVYYEDYTKMNFLIFILIFSVSVFSTLGFLVKRGSHNPNP